MHVCCACDMLLVGLSSFFTKEHFLVIFRSWVVVDASPGFLCDWFVSYNSFCFMVSSCVRCKRVASVGVLSLRALIWLCGCLYVLHLSCAWVLPQSPKLQRALYVCMLTCFEMHIIWCSAHLWHLLLYTDCLLCCDVGVLSACILCCCKAENNKLLQQEITLQNPFIFSCWSK